MANPNKDLDAFLTSVESKLRGPFSSGEIVRAVKTAPRDNMTGEEYLHKISQVIGRADKIKSMRLMVGLLGLDPSKEIDAEIREILQQAQDAPLAEDWVRVIAGVVQGILFRDDEGQPLRGDEAKEKLESTCAEVMEHIQTVIKETEEVTDDKPTDLTKADIAPTYAPFEYAIMSNEARRSLLPDVDTHSHFTVNEDAEVLKIDEIAESSKAKEEEIHAKQTRVTDDKGDKVDKVSAPTREPILPGATSRSGKPSAERPKTGSIFNTTKKPIPEPGGLRVRKNVKDIIGAGKTIKGATSLAALGARGRAAAKLGNGKSKMQMIDISEVNQLQSKSSEVRMHVGGKRGLKRRAELEESNAAKAAKLEKETPSVANNAAMASSALSKYQAMVQGQAASKAPADNNDARKQASSKQSTDWRQILKEQSNKLSDEDRVRVQHFYTDRFNPTPDQLKYKMKLHEERKIDPESGKQIKETYYLELDYTNFSSQQSKKIKRY